jgi:hypothetical protein
MRRGLAIVLMLLSWLGTEAAAFAADGESSLPACCRRHGQHHCAMNAETAAAAMQESGTAIGAPARCPNFPQSTVPSTTPVSSLIHFETGLAADLQQPLLPSDTRTTAHLTAIRAHADRGPPSLLFS